MDRYKDHKCEALLKTVLKCLLQVPNSMNETDKAMMEFQKCVDETKTNQEKTNQKIK